MHFSLALEVGRRRTSKAREKRPGDEVEFLSTSYAQTKVSINFLLTIDTHYLKGMAVVKSAHGKILLQSPLVYSCVSEWIELRETTIFIITGA